MSAAAVPTTTATSPSPNGILTEAIVLSKTKQPSLAHVTKFNLWGNDVSDISILSRMKSVEVLSLSVNKIESLRDFTHCPNLRELYLRKNRVSSLADVHLLRGLAQLRILWLAENPCAQTENYRLLVISILPQLTKLDDTDVTDAEREMAKKLNPDPSKMPTLVRRTSGSYAAPAPVAMTAAAPAGAAASASAAVAKPTPTLVRQMTHSIRTQENVMVAVMALLEEFDEEHLRWLKNETERRINKLSSAAATAAATPASPANKK